MNHSTAPRNSLARQPIDLTHVSPIVFAVTVVFPSYFVHLLLRLLNFTDGKRPVILESALLSRRQFPSLMPFVAIV